MHCVNHVRLLTTLTGTQSAGPVISVFCNKKSAVMGQFWLQLQTVRQRISQHRGSCRKQKILMCPHLCCLLSQYQTLHTGQRIWTNSSANWFLLIGGGRFNCSPLRTLRNRDTAVSKELQEAVTDRALRRRDRQDTMYVYQSTSERIQ